MTSLGGLFSRFAVLMILGITLGVSARDDIKVYRVPKTLPAAAKVPAGHPPMTGQAEQVTLKYQTPDGWNAVSPGQIRVASFNIKDQDGKQADVSVIPLPGMAGGDAPNVNRWRGQVGLGSLTQEELKQTALPVTVAGKPADLYDLAGTNTASGEPSRILGTIQHRDGTAWFYKMTGDDKLVAGHKEKFIAFLKSVEYVAGGATAGLPPSHPPLGGDSLPQGHPPVGEGLPPGHPEVSKTPQAAAPISKEGQPKWEVPSGWKEVSGGQFLAAKFILGGAGAAQTAVNVSTSSGDGGGLASNVNRWRGQLGLEPWSAAELAKAVKISKVNGGEATWVELSGKDARSGQPAAILGAMVPQGGQTWFYKLMGDAKIVEAQRAAFTRFVETVKY